MSLYSRIAEEKLRALRGIGVIGAQKGKVVAKGAGECEVTRYHTWEFVAVCTVNGSEYDINALDAKPTARIEVYAWIDNDRGDEEWSIRAKGMVTIYKVGGEYRAVVK